MKQKIGRLIFMLAVALAAVVMGMHYLSDVIMDLEIETAKDPRALDGSSSDGGIVVESPQ